MNKLTGKRTEELKINLQLFAGGGGGERTEKATAKKRQDARKKGQVLQSREITTAMVLLFAFITLRVFGSMIYREISEFARKVFVEYPQTENLYMTDIIKKLFAESVLLLLKTMAPLFLVTMLTGIIVSYAQVGFLFTMETISPKFERINPFKGFKRLFSVHGAVELVKSLLKVTIISYVAYSYLNGKAADLLQMMNMDVANIATFIALTAINVAVRICIALLLLGVLDYAYQWWEYEKNLKMTKQEVKEEYKQQEGNPEVKSKIKQKQRQMSMRRMIQEVPKADVVITNPTHFACAIKYDSKVSDAPLLIAKGQDYMAQRIKEIAKENRIEIVENKPLARTIYDTVDIGKAIPPELYQAVAEILAFVYNLKGKVPGR